MTDNIKYICRTYHALNNAVHSNNGYSNKFLRLKESLAIYDIDVEYVPSCFGKSSIIVKSKDISIVSQCVEKLGLDLKIEYH